MAWIEGFAESLAKEGDYFVRWEEEKDSQLLLDYSDEELGSVCEVLLERGLTLVHDEVGLKVAKVGEADYLAETLEAEDIALLFAGSMMG